MSLMTQMVGFFGVQPDRELEGRSRAHCRAVARQTEHSRQVESTFGGYGTWAQFSAEERGVVVAVVGEPLVRVTTGHRWQRVENPARSILDAYRTEGAGLLADLGGRFSLAILDPPRQRAMLAIDAMGIEKLSYTTFNGALLFGSSSEAVAKFPGRASVIAPQAILDYLVLHMIPAPRTVFEGVRKLRPGHCVTFEMGVATEHRYWPEDGAVAVGSDFTSLKAQLFQTLRTAVHDAGPTANSGAFLSGGLDSSSVAGILSEVGPKPARTFTIGFGYPDYDELPFARVANAHFGCTGSEYTVSGQDIADSFALIAQVYDEPFGNSSALPVYYCAKLAMANGVDHLFAGDGGDELFAGNSRYAEQEVFERYRRLPAVLRKGAIEPILKRWPSKLDFWLTRRGRGYVEKANVPLPMRLELWNLLNRLGASEMLHPEFRSAIDERGTFADMEALWNSVPAETSLGKMLQYDWQYTLSDNDLRKVCTMSGVAGVRVSFPMLHPDVVALSASVSPDLLMPGTQLRHFYKRAMNGFLPDVIINKKKHGFGLPFGLWLQETPRLREQIYGNLSSLRRRNIIRPELIARLLQLHGQDDAKYYGVFIWVLAMLEQWLQEHHQSV